MWIIVCPLYYVRIVFFINEKAQDRSYENLVTFVKYSRAVLIKKCNSNNILLQ